MCEILGQVDKHFTPTREDYTVDYKKLCNLPESFELSVISNVRQSRRTL